MTRKKSYFHSISAKVLYNLMIIQAVPLGLKNTSSGRAVTEPANIMEELSVGFPRQEGFLNSKENNQLITCICLITCQESGSEI